MKFPAYLETVLARRAPLPDAAAHAKHAGSGLITEVGELMDPFKRFLAYAKPIDSVNVMEECGDYMWYLILFADSMAIHMAALQKSFDENNSIVKELKDADDYMVVTSLTFVSTSLAIAVSAKFTSPDGRGEISGDDIMELITGAACIIKLLLARHGYTMDECLDRNDAKLALRTAQKRAEMAGRDLAAERKALEGDAA
jgi:NTP pyrophosphatase (non-canonical NTP hydrolase)